MTRYLSTEATSLALIRRYLSPWRRWPVPQTLRISTFFTHAMYTVYACTAYVPCHWGRTTNCADDATPLTTCHLKYLKWPNSIVWSYLPSVQSMATLYLPSVQSMTTLYLPSVQSMTTLYLPSVQSMATLYLPSVQSMATLYLPVQNPINTQPFNTPCSYATRIFIAVTDASSDDSPASGSDVRNACCYRRACVLCLIQRKDRFIFKSRSFLQTQINIKICPSLFICKPNFRPDTASRHNHCLGVPYMNSDRHFGICQLQNQSFWCPDVWPAISCLIAQDGSRSHDFWFKISNVPVSDDRSGG
jgi:hypothetical protein